jgi:hypothetical protein
LEKNIGAQSPNCVTQDEDNILFLSSQLQLRSLSPSQGMGEPGLDVAPTIATDFPAASSYLAIHRAGPDQGMFLSDNSSKVLRYNINSESWDTVGTAANGIGPLASVDTAIGTRRLLSTAGGYVVFRDVNTYSDNGSAYPAYATIGSLMLAPLGEPALSVKNFIIATTAVGTAPAISVLPNEISGSFTSMPYTNADPWQLPASATINIGVYNWMGVQSVLPNIIRHMQVKVTFPTEAYKSEVHEMAIV